MPRIFLSPCCKLLSVCKPLTPDSYTCLPCITSRAYHYAHFAVRKLKPGVGSFVQSLSNTQKLERHAPSSMLNHLALTLSGLCGDRYSSRSSSLTTPWPRPFFPMCEVCVYWGRGGGSLCSGVKS